MRLFRPPNSSLSFLSFPDQKPWVCYWLWKFNKFMSLAMKSYFYELRHFYSHNLVLRSPNKFRRNFTNSQPCQYKNLKIIQQLGTNFEQPKLTDSASASGTWPCRFCMLLSQQNEFWKSALLPGTAAKSISSGVMSTPRCPPSLRSSSHCVHLSRSQFPLHFLWRMQCCWCIQAQKTNTLPNAYYGKCERSACLSNVRSECTRSTSDVQLEWVRWTLNETGRRCKESRMLVGVLAVADAKKKSWISDKWFGGVATDYETFGEKQRYLLIQFTMI